MHIRFKFFLLFLIILFIFSPILNFGAEQQVSFNNQIKKELLRKNFLTKIPLGKNYLFQDKDGYSVDLKVVNEIYPEEIKYLAEGGLKVGKLKKWDGSISLRPNLYSSRYVSLSEIESIPERIVMQVEKVEFKRDEIEIKLTKDDLEAKLKLKLIANLDFEAIMTMIGKALHIEYIESLQPLSLKKRQVEIEFKKARLIEERFMCAFEIKQIIEEILRIENLSNIIHSKYSKEVLMIDELIKQLYGELEEPIILVESLIIHPDVANPGETLKLELKYNILAPQKKSQFKISESVILSRSNDRFELIKRESERSQGQQLFTFQFVIPMDLQPGEYSLTTTIGIGKQKKTVSGSFKLMGKHSEAKGSQTTWPAPTLKTKDTDFIVAGELYFNPAMEEEIKNLIPVVVFYSGKYTSAWEVVETTNPLKQKILNIDKFWLYYKGNLIGNFVVRGFKSASEETEFQPSLIGRISWESKSSVDLLTIAENTIALSHPIPQPFYPKDLKLNSKQVSELNRLIRETLIRPQAWFEQVTKKEGIEYKGTQMVIGKAPKEKAVNIFLLEPGGPYAVYANEHWEGEPCYEMYASVLAIWDSRWVILKRSTHLSEGLCGTGVGDAKFFVGMVGDIDGDGVAELIVNEGIWANWNKALYRISNGKLIKLVDIGTYGL